MRFPDQQKLVSYCEKKRGNHKYYPFLKPAIIEMTSQIAGKKVSKTKLKQLALSIVETHCTFQRGSLCELENSLTADALCHLLLQAAKRSSL